MPAMVISVEAAHIDNAIVRDYLAYEVALEEPEIGSTDPNIPIDNNCMDEQLHYGMPGVSGDYEDEGDESDVHNAISTASRRMNSRGLTWEPVMSTGRRVRMVKMRMRMRRKKHRKPMMDQCRMWRTQGIVGFTCEPVMSTGMSASMVTIWMRMRRNKHRKPMMNQRRMWRTAGIVLESMKIGLYISDL